MLQRVFGALYPNLHNDTKGMARCNNVLDRINKKDFQSAILFLESIMFCFVLFFLFGVRLQGRFEVILFINLKNDFKYFPHKQIQ